MPISRYQLPLVFALILAANLPGCAGSPPPADPWLQIEQLRQGGYMPVQDEVQGWQEQWQLGGQVLDVAWLAPAKARNAPLVIYLPGLGEGALAGELWRRSWAEAGYAVLSLQPASFGRSVFASTDAQTGAFQQLARRVYGDQALKQRLAAVEAVLQEARRLAAAGDSRLAGVDWQHWAVAGFELGAQTAAALAGERDGERLSALQPGAAILLSPAVAEGSVPSRFSGVDTPLLSISGPRDEDPLAWVALPERRDVLWRGVQVSGSYRLIAINADHATLSGGLPGPMPGARGGSPKERPAGPPPQMPLAFGEPGGRGPGGDGGPGGPGGRPGHGRPMGHGAGMQEAFDARQVANVQAVSLAFLDARLRGSAEARRWLDEGARSWLGDTARLDAKP